MVFWQIADHSIALTGDGFYDEYPHSDWVAVRCLGCPGVNEGGTGGYPLWHADEVRPAQVRWENGRILDAVVRHLREGGTVVPDDVIAAAHALAGLSGLFDSGLEFIQDHLGGGEREYR